MEWLDEPQEEISEIPELYAVAGICIIRYCSNKANCVNYNCVVLWGG